MLLYCNDAKWCNMWLHSAHCSQIDIQKCVWGGRLGQNGLPFTLWTTPRHVAKTLSKMWGWSLLTKRFGQRSYQINYTWMQTCLGNPFLFQLLSSTVSIPHSWLVIGMEQALRTSIHTESDASCSPASWGKYTKSLQHYDTPWIFQGITFGAPKRSWCWF